MNRSRWKESYKEDEKIFPPLQSPRINAICLGAGSLYRLASYFSEVSSSGSRIGLIWGNSLAFVFFWY
jgi:hypothetical protein